MTTKSRSNWEHGNVDLTATTKAYLICKIHGGESAWIKANLDNTTDVAIGSAEDVVAATGYDLEPGEGLELKHDISFGVNSFIEVWARGATAGDDVTYVKLIQNKEIPVRQADKEAADTVA